MLESLHNHTPRCHHAVGSEREYIEEAIRSGVRTLGFSDHSPYVFPRHFVSNMRMRPEELGDYVNTLLKLRKEYKDRIRILIGFEMEYFPAYFRQTLDLISNYPIDYLILGQHFFDSEAEGGYCGTPTSDPVLLRRYTDRLIEGIKTGKFLFIAHPDLFYFTGDKSVYRAETMRMLEAAKKYNDTPMEFNLYGYTDGRHYPREEFFRLVKEAGCRVVISSDAHSPDRVADEHEYEIAEIFLSRLGITPVRQLFATDA